MTEPHHKEAIAADRHLRLCRGAGVEPALGLAMDLAPLDRSVLLLVGETADGQRIAWVERSGIALDVRGEGTLVRDRDAFRAGLGLRPPVALDRYLVRSLWVTNGEDPKAAHEALARLLDDLRA